MGCSIHADTAPAPCLTHPSNGSRTEPNGQDHHRAVIGPVESGDEVEQVRLERFAAGFADGLERLQRRTVVAPPILDERQW